MPNIFGIPILVSIGLGLAFPYVAFQLIPLGILFLFLLMMFAGVTIDWSKLTWRVVFSRPVLLGLFLLYIVFPLCQWFLARLIVEDGQYLYGLVLASLCPVAIVAPYFVQSTKSDTELCFVLVAVSMILFPVVAPFATHLLLSSNQTTNTVPLLKYMVLLVTVPTLLGFLIQKFTRTLTLTLKTYIGHLNMLCLSCLIFILFGTVARKLNLYYIQPDEIGVLIFLVFVQNFVVLLIARSMLLVFFNSTTALSIAISLSMKNYAVAAGLLLFYDPKAALPAALGFLAHAFLFNFIFISRRTRFFQPE